MNKPRFHTKLTTINIFMFFGQKFWRIFDNKLGLWRFGMYKTEEAAIPYVEKLNKEYS